MSFVIAMLLVAQGPLMTTNADYTGCLTALTVESLDAKKSADQFEKAAETECAGQKTAYRNAVIQSELEFGSSQAEAETYADEETENIMSSTKKRYADYLDTNSRPVID